MNFSSWLLSKTGKADKQSGRSDIQEVNTVHAD